LHRWLARIAGSCTFFTALGHDERANWTRDGLERRGVRIESIARDEPSRRAVVFVDRNGERTITTLGRRLQPIASDPLPWDELQSVDAVYFTAGDVGALHHARRARVLVATSRVMDLLGEADVALDAVVGSGRDPSERFEAGALSTPPGVVVTTNSVRGGGFETADGRSGRYEPVAPPGPVVDTYGAGDCFAAGLTYALGARLPIQGALALAARCGAWSVAGQGPYGNHLGKEDL
jgi:ribokinase